MRSAQGQSGPVLDRLRIAALFHLDVPDLPTEGIAFEGLKLVRQAPIVKDLLPQVAVLAMGALEYEALLSTPVLLLSEQVVVSSASELMTMEPLYQFMRAIRMFLHALWLVKDNAVNLEQGFQVLGKDDTYHTQSVGTGRQFTTASGCRPRTSLSKDEIVSGARLWSDLQLGKAVPPSVKTREKTSRLARSLFFLQSARGADNVAMKIAQICSALEALFATESTELTHKLSERVAVFLADDGKERLRIYKHVKDAYGVRSSLLHGAKLPQNDRGLELISSDLDVLLRAAYTSILNSSERGLYEDVTNATDRLTEFFLKKLME